MKIKTTSRACAVWTAIAAVWMAAPCIADEPCELKTPETSRLFVRHVDPFTGVESWLLKPGIFSFHQQGCYFTQKSMTDDGRFIFFWARDPEFEPDGKTKKKNRLNTTALIDFKTDTIVDLRISPQIPFLDVKTDQLWYFRTEKVDGKTERHVCRRDFLVDPLKEIVVCKVPDALLKDVKKVHYLSTHPTLTTDRKKMFIAAHLDDRYEQGCINLETGAWESWGTTPFFANHDQLNPVRDDIALLAWENCARTEDAIAYKKKTGWYPRMWLAYPDGRRELQPSRIPDRNYATHEHWAEDGKGFYWCASGVHYQNLATGEQETVCPMRAAHATMSANNRLVTFDMSVGKWYRGCRWQVGFWNRDAKQGIYIHAVRPKLCDDDGSWHDHPDPHPAFVCKDKYVLCTMNGDDARMNLSLTPVAPLVARTATRPAKAPRAVMNVVNFVRALDPRQPRAWYAEALREEVALNRKHKLKNTILFQYDALIDPELRAEAAKSDPKLTEFGLWFEMSRPLNEAAGLPWRPKHDPSWDWDWFINPGFLMAYTHAERKALIDAAFARFKADFGAYPKSVGSWLLDAWSMDYMVKTYGVDGFCICREQDNTDAYGLRGGYSNGAYYPSRRNMLSAAVDMANAVPAPVFKMLTPDPIYNYANPKARFPDYPFKSGCPTLEPVWAGGNVKPIVDWYFRTYISAPGLINLSYMQTGQENSFGWANIKKGLPYQCERIAAARDAGILAVETMGETARRFKAEHPQNCPQTQVALEDWSGADRNSIWYNSRFYRANLFRDGTRLYFRDIHKMSDAFEEPFLDTVCTGWQANYFTPPVVDEFLFRTNGVSGVMSLDGTFTRLDASAGPDDTLAVVATRTDGSTAKIVFDERGIRVEGVTLAADYAPAFRQTTDLRGDKLSFEFQGFRYEVACQADVTPTASGFTFRPRAGTIRLDLSLPN